MTLCKMTTVEQKTFEKLILSYNNARQDIENFLEELKGEWESTLSDKSESFQDSQSGQDAQSRIDTLEGWLDEVSNDFDPDLSEVS